LLQKNNDQQQQLTQGQANMMQSNTQFGGYELFHIDDALGALVVHMEQYNIYKDHVQCQTLAPMLQRQHMFITQLYNTVLDTLKSGKDPAVKTQTYMMQEQNETAYGMSKSAPKKPIQSLNEINDERISTFMLDHLKSLASHFTMTAIEATNPVIRRIFADSVPNVIEMAYELYLYQNKRGHYEIAQLDQQQTEIMKQKFAPIDQHMQH